MTSRASARRLKKVIAFGSVVAILAACGSDDPKAGTSSPSGSAGSAWEQVVAAAKKEGGATFYTPVAEVTVNKWRDAFAKAYPDIKLTVLRADQPTTTARLAAEAQSGTKSADVVVNGIDGPTTTLGRFDAEGKLAPLIGPNFKEKDVQAAKQTDNRYFVGVNIVSWAWNTKLVPNGIREWKDLLDPSLKGKIGTYDGSLSPLVPAWFAGQAEAAGDPDWLEKFAAQKPRIYPGTTVQENAVAAGELAATPFATNNVLGLKAKGAPVDWAVAPKGAGVAGLEVGVLKNATSPNAAQVFANWLLSVEAQLINLATGATPARANIPGNNVEFASLKVTVPVTAAEHKAFIEKFNKLFK